MISAFRQLTDAGVSPQTRSSLLRALDPLLPPNGSAKAIGSPSERSLLAVKDLRAMRAGALMFVDLTAEVPRTLNVADTSALESRIARSLKAAKKEITEVRVKFSPVDVEKTM